MPNLANWALSPSNMRSAGWVFDSQGQVIVRAANVQQAAQLRTLSGPLVSLLTTDVAYAAQRLRANGNALSGYGRSLARQAAHEDALREFERAVNARQR